MDYNTYKEIPNNLKLCRLKRGLSQKDVAAILGFKDTTLLSRWENGNSLPNIVHIIRLSILYQASVEILFAGFVERLRAEIRSEGEAV